jgi:hypothetical protein
MVAGAPWRYMSTRYGNWNSLLVRFRRWSQQGASHAAHDDVPGGSDSTIIRHTRMPPPKGGIDLGKRSGARVTDSRPRVSLTGGDAHEVK